MFTTNSAIGGEGNETVPCLRSRRAWVKITLCQQNEAEEMKFCPKFAQVGKIRANKFACRRINPTTSHPNSNHMYFVFGTTTWAPDFSEVLSVYINHVDNAVANITHSQTINIIKSAITFYRRQDVICACRGRTLNGIDKNQRLLPNSICNTNLNEICT